MGTNIVGYIETNTIRESDEDIWFEVIKIDILAERNYEIFGHLFGVRSEAGIIALASSRGIPIATSNPSVMKLTLAILGLVGVNWN